MPARKNDFPQPPKPLPPVNIALTAQQKLTTEYLKNNPAEYAKLVPRMNKYFIHRPWPKQWAMLLWNGLEGFYGGAAGPGKTDYLLMAASQFVDVPNYSAVLIRRTWTDLNQPGGLIPRSKQWWMHTDAEWSETKRCWTFPPHGSTIQFMHMEHEDDRYAMQGLEAQFIGFDELTQFAEIMYRYAFSRLRKSLNNDVPLRVRSTSNPGGFGHDWVKRRFITEWWKMPPDKRSQNMLVMLGTLVDNPSIDREAYERSLKELPTVERKRLLEGDWDARDGDLIFKRSWFKVVDYVPKTVRMWRFWDLAALRKGKQKGDPDWAAGVKMGVDENGLVWVDDLVRLRGTGLEIEQAVRATAERDGQAVPVWIEQEPGSAGLQLMQHYERQVLRGFSFTYARSTGEVAVRAMPWAGYVENGYVHVRTFALLEQFLSEHENFTGKKDAEHDDIVSACSHGFANIYTPQETVVESYLSEDLDTDYAVERILGIE